MSDDHSASTPGLADYQRALDSMDTFMDVSAKDLMALAQRARQFAIQRRIEKRRVADIMTAPVIHVRPDTPLSAAAHLMVTKQISGLPVVGEADRLVGIITEADLLRTLGVPAHEPTHSVWQTLESMLSHLSRHDTLHGPDDPVSRHMQGNVVCVAGDDDIERVLELMKQHRVKRLVVCDAQQHPLGMVTRSNLVRTFFDRFTRHA